MPHISAEQKQNAAAAAATRTEIKPKTSQQESCCVKSKTYKQIKYTVPIKRSLYLKD